MKVIIKLKHETRTIEHVERLEIDSDPHIEVWEGVGGIKVWVDESLVYEEADNG